MKRILLSILLILVLVPAGAILWLISSPSYTDPWPVDEKLNSFYKETYEDSRAEFRKTCEELKAKIPGTTASVLKVESRVSDDLTIDTCLVPSGGAGKPGSIPNSARLLIVTSGVHGGEGFASSAVQRMFMTDLLAQRNDRPETLLVHAINAYGMKYFRRVTENNVDLNRNFDVNPSMFSVKNPGYTEVNALLNPTTKADLSSFMHRFFALRAIIEIASKGMGPLRQAILQGQYEIPDGIYFGGKNFEQQKIVLEPIFKRASAGKSLVVTVDLHTGYGERGKAHLFPNTPPNNEVRELTEKLFKGYRIDWPGGDFYSTYGDFSAYIGLIQEKSVKYVPMVFEYGVLDSQTTKGSLVSIHRVILENQAIHYGCVSEEDCAKIKADFREAYYPASPSWRSKVMRDSKELFTNTLDRMNDL